MQKPTEAVLLRIFVCEEDRHGHRPVYEAIVERALNMRMAGATVLPGLGGFGRSRRVRSELTVDAGPHLPMVVEIVDAEPRIDQFLAVLGGMIESGLVTLEKVTAFRYPAKAADER
jgi:uncharacterized protein